MPDAEADDDWGVDEGDIPPEVAVRLARALDRLPTALVSLLDNDLRIRWMSRSATWVTGSIPEVRKGESSLNRIHPDDAEKLLHGLAQMRQANQGNAPIPGPLRYRFQRMDNDEWVMMEAHIHNLSDDPVVQGMLSIARPVEGELDGVGHVIDLLVADVPLPQVLAACATLVPPSLGVAALVGLVGPHPVIGVKSDSPAAQLVKDDRWWRTTLADGQGRVAAGFAGFPADLVEQARAEGFRNAWVSPLRDGQAAEVIGCLVVWVRHAGERNIAADEQLRQTERLASLVLGEQRRNQALQREALTDPLTGVGNRSALRRRLDDATGAVTVAILDLDAFKPINDTYGHDAGDAVLQVVAQRVLHAVRDDDLVVRFGGDEFAVVFADGTPPAGSQRSAQRLVAAIQEPIQLDDVFTVRVGASIGVATGPPDEVVKAADARLYEAKQAGRG
jgi:diguanylate cyclase (GGDEF)-like protein